MPIDDTTARKDAPATPQVVAATSLRRADALFSEVWPKFTRDKILMKKWKSTEAHAAGTTMRLWLQCCGDRKPCDYTSSDVSRFHEVMNGLPRAYYHNRVYRQVYKKEGVLAVVAMSEGHAVERVSDKTWNSHNSSLNSFFMWCAGKGKALPEGTASICSEEFVHIAKEPVRQADDPSRVLYSDEQIRAMFSAPKFTGAVSGHFWRKPGSLVVRDHRYWMTLIGAYHGNRREEAAVLKVKHVPRSATGIAYFNWKAPELRVLLKEKGSPRDVPIHEDLLKLEFMAARVDGRDPEAPLFPEAVSYGVMERDAGPFGSWFGHFRTSCGVSDPRLDFHAFRHTVSTGLLRAGVPQSHAEEIVGHESKDRRSEISRYNHGMTIELLKDAIDKLVFPIDVDVLGAAVIRSDAIRRSAAWPDLSDPGLVPKPKKARAKP